MKASPSKDARFNKAFMSLFNYRSRFFLKNLMKGLMALTVIVVSYILLQKYTAVDAFMDYIGRWPLIVYTVFIFSEVVFGLIPPELFMIWSIKNGAFDIYALNVALLALISYLAGVLGYFVGARLKDLGPVRSIFQRYIKRYQNALNRYGGFLIIVAAITPVPFSAICMLMGATRYNFYRFLLIASVRFIRFAAYSTVIYQANI
ncbi:VTT domain-containing protein [Fulvivirga kasyanovii]